MGCAHNALTFLEHHTPRWLAATAHLENEGFMIEKIERWLIAEWRSAGQAHALELGSKGARA
jgi:hypothetical protein